MKPCLMPLVLSGLFFFTTRLLTSHAFAADSPPRTKIRIATAGLNADLPPVTIFDFSLSAAAAKEIAAKK